MENVRFKLIANKIVVRQKRPPHPGRGTNTDTGNNKQITENRNRYQSETLFKYVSMCTQASTSLSNKRTGVLLQPANVRPVGGYEIGRHGDKRTTNCYGERHHDQTGQASRQQMNGELLRQTL